MVLCNDYLGQFFQLVDEVGSIKCYIVVSVFTFVCVEAHCFDPDSLAGSAVPLKPCDPCSQHRFSTSFIHLIDMQPIIHAEYHMKGEKRV